MYLHIIPVASTLYADLTCAKRLFSLKHKAFTALCKIYANKVREWNTLDRSTRTLVRKEIECVYRQRERSSECILLYLE